MRPLSLSDCRALSSALETVYQIRSIAEFPAGTLSAARSLVGCNTICFNEVTLPNTITTWVTSPANALPGDALRNAFMRNFPQHPVLAHYTQTGDGTSHRISDFLSRRQFHNLPLYAEYYRPSGIECQLVAAISTGRCQVGIALDRDIADFSEDERLTLDLLRPHLLQAYRNAQTMDIMRRVMEDKAVKLLAVSRSAKTAPVPDEVWQLLDRYFEVPRLNNSLPDMLKNWISSERSRFGNDGDAPSLSVPLVISQGSQGLTVRFLWGGKTADHDTILLEERPARQGPAAVIDSVLTERETEILAWLSEGKTNAEIGLALSVSPLTVKKHLEHIYAKLEVHRRGAAVARSRRV